jgi:hypothetical protein
MATGMAITPLAFTEHVGDVLSIAPARADVFFPLTQS